MTLRSLSPFPKIPLTKILFIPLPFLLISCSTQVLNVEKQPDGAYWISSSSTHSEKSAFEAGEKQARETAEKYKTTFKIIKKKPTSKSTTTPAHYETRWVDQVSTISDGSGKVRTIRTSIPVSDWIPERTYTTYYSEIWVRFNSPVTMEKP